jgi:sigma-E factor negative regulatory protein RseB
MLQLSHWRVASAAAVFVLAGSSAVALAMHDAPAGQQTAYRSLPVPPPVHRRPAVLRTAAARAGLQLMNQAAAACRATAFSGIQVSRWWGPGGLRVWMTEIWHRPGGQMLAQPADTAAGAELGIKPSARPEPNVSMVISPAQLSLLEADYELDYVGHSSADGRVADLVAVERPDGVVAAKYWLDAQTKLPLRRQVFDTHARLVSDISVADVRFGPQSLGGMPQAVAQPYASQLDDAAIGSLRATGWPLPGQLPGGMVLFAATRTPTSAGPVIGLSYTDGLSVISLFVQRGQLAGAMAGWQRIAIGGHDAYAVDPDDQTIAWSSGGYVFTMLADAPVGTMEQAIAVLPHASPAGFWARLGRGFRRLASWANPFR